MRRVGCWFCLLLLAVSTAARAEEVLPAAVEQLIKKNRLAKADVGVVVRRLQDGRVLVRHQAGRLFNPASVVKVVTAMAAVDRLGLRYRWKTVFATDGEVREGVLDGDLYLIGGGDPYITTDRFLFMLNDLRNQGIRKIKGALVIDEGFFDLPPFDSAAFDGAGNRPYNVGAGGMVVNFKTLRVWVAPGTTGVRVYTDPPNDHFVIDNRLGLRNSGRCSSWRQRVHERLGGRDNRLTLTLKGSYPKRCGMQSFYLSALEHGDYVAGLFGALWRRLGGEWAGGYRFRAAPEGVRPLAVFESPPLAEVLAAMNKYSNNVIARHLFLSLAETPRNLTTARKVMRGWLARQGVVDALVDNGSGLSRESRISPAAMGRLLDVLWRHPYREEILSSLPLWGIDGTLRKRNGLTRGMARFKTGSLVNSKTLGGFFRDPQGRYLSVVVFAKNSSSLRVKRFQEDLLKWLSGLE